MWKTVALLVAGLLAVADAQAGFAALTGQQLLTQFNLVTLGDAKIGSDVEGRVYVGGNLTQTAGSLAQRTLPTSNYAAATVVGSATGLKVDNNNPTSVGAVVGGSLSGATINNGGAVVSGNVTNSTINGSSSYKAYVGGTVSGSNINTTKVGSLASDATLSNAAAAATSTDMAAVATALSSQLAALKANSTATRVGNKTVFKAVADANGYAVFTLTADLLSAGEFEFDLSGISSTTTIIFNVDLTDVVINANFLGGSALGLLSTNAVWNFYKATSITIGSQFGGSILAPSAKLTNTADIEGSVIVSSLDSKGEIHLHSFGGNVTTPTNQVPEPSSLALVATSVVLLALARRRRAPARAAA